MRHLNLSDLFRVAVERHRGQCAVAKRCGISQSMVSLYVAGKHRSIKAANVARIAQCLGVSPIALLRACRDNVSIDA